MTQRSGIRSPTPVPPRQVMTLPPVGPSVPRTDLFSNAFLGMQQVAPDPTDIVIGLVLLGAGRAPDIEDIRRVVGERLGQLPALTHCAVPGDFGFEWRPAADFDLTRHVTVRPDLPAQPATAGVLLGSTLDLTHPLWWMVLLPGDGQRWALAYLVHHAVQDGTAALRTLEIFFGGSQLRAAAPPRRSPSRWQALRALPNLAGTWRAARELAALPTPARSSRTLTYRTVSASALRNIGAAAGTTTAQTHLAAVAGALREWSPEDFTGRRAGDVAAIVPVDTRNGDEFPTSGSLIGLLRVRLPTSAADPADRLRSMRQRLSRRRVAVNRAAQRALAEQVPVRWAASAIRRLGDRGSVGFTFSVLRALEPLAVCDRDVEQVVALPFLPPGHSCFALLARYRDQAVLSVLSDEEPLSQPSLADCWERQVSFLHNEFSHAQDSPRRRP